jgi:deoxyadenosine/deoxycytidine kinase
MKIVIDGNIGCGKSTVMTRLNKRMGIPIVLEPLQKWDKLLSLFYQNPNKWAFPFNLEVIHSFCQWKHIDYPVLIERSPVSCREVFTQLNYESGHMHDLELEVFDKVYKELSWEPDVLLYIRTDPSVCVQRMKERARECEKEVSIDYINEIHKKYETMIQNAGFKVHIIDGNQDGDTVFEEIRTIVEQKMVQYYHPL